MKILNAISLSAVLLSSSLLAKEFAVDSVHSNVGFSIKHMGISKVNGNFTKQNSIIDIDPKTKVIKKLEANIKSNSINTQNEGRDAHLNQADFFDTAKFPDIKFVMTKFEQNEDEGKITGDLSIKGITKQVVLKSEINGFSKNHQGKEIFGMSLEGKINRNDFKIGTSMMSKSLSDEVKLNIDIEGIEK